jgi:hypothetical protein
MIAPQLYIIMADHLPHSLAMLLLQLRTGHIPLARHLHKIKKADLPLCPCCRLADKTVEHYLIHCPAHRDARRELVRAGGLQTQILTKLLGSPKLIPHLFRFLGCTSRFHTVHGELPPLPETGLPTHNGALHFLNNLSYPEPGLPHTAAPFAT